jgi:hypothetical protein
MILFLWNVLNTSFRDVRKEIVCNPRDVRTDTIPNGQTSKGCKSESVIEKVLGVELPPVILREEIVRLAQDTGLFLYSTTPVDNFGCRKSYILKKMTPHDTTIAGCDKKTGIYTEIQPADDVTKSEVMVRTHYTFDICTCFEKETIYYRLITNDADAKNNVLKLVHHELYPPIDLVVVDKRGMVVYESLEKPFKSDWSGTNRAGEPLPAGVYYYILRLRQEGPPCVVRRGHLDIQYID